MSSHANLDMDFNQTMRRLEALTPVVQSILGNAEAWLESFPLPAWVKAPTGEMSYINECYMRVYDKDREDYIGRKDKAVWEDETAKSFGNNDKLVADSGEPMIFSEGLTGDRKVLVLKFPVFDGSKFLGVGGIVIHDNRTNGIPRIAAALAAQLGSEG